MEQRKIVKADAPMITEYGLVMRFVIFDDGTSELQSYWAIDSAWKPEDKFGYEVMHPLTSTASDERLAEEGYTQEHIERIMTDEFTGRRFDGSIPEDEL